MGIEININKDLCTTCGRCVKVCPSLIFKMGKEIKVVHQDSCIGCGHCVAACQEGAVNHSLFPTDKVHKIDYSQLPTPGQLMLLCKTRRSNRAFSTKPIPAESLNLILEAAHRAPTGSNLQQVKFTQITDPEKLRLISDFTMDIFGSMMKKVKNPLIKPIIRLMMPGVLRYIPVFERMEREYARGNDMILRKAHAVMLIYTPKSNRMGAADANLAYQNGSLMAECLGVSQFYTGFVLNAVKQDKKNKLAVLLGIDGEINAGMALGMPLFRYPKYIDRKQIEVDRI